MRTVRNWIDGEARDAVGGLWSELIDPASGRVTGRAAVSREEDVAAAYEAAERAAPAWAATTPGERSRLLLAMADMVERRLEEFVDMEVAETGKPRATLLNLELPVVINEFRFFAGAARGLEGIASQEFVSEHTSVIRREPIGVVGQIAPWNYPFAMAVWKVAPALATGNTVVFKPAETTPSSAVALAELASKMLGPGVLNVVTGDRDTGRAVVESPVPGLVSITGSTRAGREVAASAAAGLKRAHLELGGKAAAIIGPDADIKGIAARLAISAFFNSGQDCTAITRIIAHENVYEKLLEQLTYETKKIRVGGPDEEGVLFGPLNSAKQLRSVSQAVENIPPHARILTGGKIIDRPGFFYPPTIIADVRQDDDIVQEEVFGPVVTVQPYKTDEEALALANGTNYGLASSIWTNDLRRANYFSRNLKAGTVWVNTHSLLTPEMPHGGPKHSGYGKDMSIYAIKEYTEIKHVMTYNGEKHYTLDDDGVMTF